MHALRCSILCLPLLWGCGSMADHPTASPADPPKTGQTTATTASTTTAAPAPLPTGLDPRRGQDIGPTFESFMSPWQQEAEESTTPASTPAEFRSTAPSLTRAQREAAGHRGVGQIRFRNDLSRAYVDVKIEGIDASTINMFHIHCGKPGILGPILVDFALATDLQKTFAKGVMSVEVTDDSHREDHRALARPDRRLPHGLLRRGGVARGRQAPQGHDRRGDVDAGPGRRDRFQPPHHGTDLLRGPPRADLPPGERRALNRAAIGAPVVSARRRSDSGSGTGTAAPPPAAPALASASAPAPPPRRW